MHLNPDEIERRSFAIEDRGYDRDEVRDFLLEVASGLRLALHTTRPPSPEAERRAGTPSASGVLAANADDFARLGAEVAEILRSAHDAVATLHEHAATEIAMRHEEAVAQADEVRRQADADAAWTHDRAKRVLITAQEQADAIVAEAEAAAADLLQAARRQAKEHADQVATRTRRHAEQILRAEREALRRLHQAQAGVAAAVEMLTGSESRPVVDLTELRPHVRLGSISVEIDDDPVPATGRPVNDPLARMIRNAVDRAAEHAQDIDPDPSRTVAEGDDGTRPGEDATRLPASFADASVDSEAPTRRSDATPSDGPVPAPSRDTDGFDHGAHGDQARSGDGAPSPSPDGQVVLAAVVDRRRSGDRSATSDPATGATR